MGWPLFEIRLQGVKKLGWGKYQQLSFEFTKFEIHRGHLDSPGELTATVQNSGATELCVISV